ncbi:TIGR04279 domain-containing protein [Methanosarcina sp. 1.H.A.2.2]|uniref:TIGR04279 domain-containing protein n=1 Tax=Methanosarcina sp. 1.H.A.2.2 TaxID=1483601 RepID=UPI000A3F41E9|nr:TIGR04279 domain-containing protein [Methanosarcina sp. 1.H.A.2.2]
MRKNLLTLKKGLLILIVTAFVLTSVLAMAEGGIIDVKNDEKTDAKTDVNPIGAINFTDRVVYFLNHTSDPDEGNWITLGNPDNETRVQLPQPINLTYSGPKYKEYGGVSATLFKAEDENYTITYPSTSASYTTHPIYLPGENVTMSFHGENGLEGDVEIYLIKVNSDCASGLFDAFKAGDIGNLDNLFHCNIEEGEYEKYCAELGNNGDLLDYDLGPLDAGEYCIVMMQENEDCSLTALSATAFVVTEYELCVDAPSSIVKGDDLDISIRDLVGAPDKSNCTYVAALIRGQAYKANIEINSDGTKNGTSIIVNEVDLIDEFDINSSNYRSKLTRNELQTEIQTLIGEGNGAIAVGEAGQEALSITAFDLPVGDYYLFVGAYSPEEGLAGLTQLDVEIK